VTQIETFMKQFPPEAEILQMSPEDLGIARGGGICQSGQPRCLAQGAFIP
jgi:hypothetical protein